MQAPIISFVAKGTNSGKTYLMEKLVGEFKARGKKVTAVKHGTHRMEVDKEGKDTWKFAQQGADRIILFSDRALLLYELKEPDLDHLVSLAREGSDIVLVEGYRDSDVPHVEVVRGTPGFVGSPERRVAVVTDLALDVDVPVFDLDDVAGVVGFLEAMLPLQPHA